MLTYLLNNKYLSTQYNINNPITLKNNPIGNNGDTAAVKNITLTTFAYLNAISTGCPSNNKLASLYDNELIIPFFSSLFLLNNLIPQTISK